MTVVAFEDLERPAVEFECLPPAHARVEHFGQVVLLDLAAVQRPAMMLVLAMVRPVAVERRPEMDPVGSEPVFRVGFVSELRRSGGSRHGGTELPRALPGPCAGRSFPASTTQST